MPILKWDDAGTKTFERGVDRGVIYLADGKAVPWSGLVTVSTQSEKDATAIHFDGKKIHDLVSVGNFLGTIQAITYPDELMALEGYGEISAGVYLEDQPPQTFDFSYRTKIGSDIDPDSTHYKIHVVYNVTAIASDREYSTISDDASMSEFEWEITAVPEEVPGFRPSAKLVIDSRYVDPDLLEAVEVALYGGKTANAKLPPFAELLEMLVGFFRIEIVDNRDGTFTANSDFDGFITKLTTTSYQLDNANIEVVDADTYRISDTRF